MTDSKLKWLGLLRHGPDNNVAIAVFVTCIVVLILHHVTFLQIPQNYVWIPWALGVYSIILVLRRGMSNLYVRWKRRPCAFSKLTQQQQNFLISKVESGVNWIDSEQLFSYQWSRDLREKNYIKVGSMFIDTITNSGWNNVEKFLRSKE